MCCGCSWKLVASWPQSLNQGVNIQLSGFSDLTRELIFDLLFGFCQIIVSWLQIILSPQKHCLLQMPLFFFTEIHTVFCTAIPHTYRVCENCPFGMSMSAKLSFGLSRFCQPSAAELEKEGRMCSLGSFPSRTLVLCSQQPL